MSQMTGWMAVAVFAVIMTGIVAGTIHLATVVVDRTVRRGLAPLAADVRALRAQGRGLLRP